MIKIIIIKIKYISLGGYDLLGCARHGFFHPFSLAFVQRRETCPKIEKNRLKLFKIVYKLV